MIFQVMLIFVMIICVMIFWSRCDDTVVMLSSNPKHLGFETLTSEYFDTHSAEADCS